MNTEPVRHQMVTQQIRTWDVSDAGILRTFDDLPRDEFVPTEFADVAYADTEIPLPHGQCMLRPSLVGKILQALNLQLNEDVLEIGTGTGYLTACIARLAASVTSIDIFEDFITTAGKKLQDAGVENVVLECMDVMSELPEGQFDVIVMTSAVPELNQAYAELLKPGGRLFVIAGPAPVRTAMLVTRTANGEFDVDELFETDIPELINLEKETIFSF